MELVKHFLYRIYQKIMVVVVKLVPNKKQILIQGDLTKLIEELKRIKINKIFIVSDLGVVKVGLVKKLTELLDKNNYIYHVYDKTNPNPEIETIEQAYQEYVTSKADAIIAIGGGSPIDLAKVVAAKVVHPNKEISSFKGILKVLKKIPPFIAIPTTSGTGSEVTIAAVVSNHKTHSKFAIIDPNLLPDIALLDPSLTVGMPKFITATTGLDALTHAIESYLGNSNTNETKDFALAAIKLVFENLEIAYHEPFNLLARENMQVAAYKAGYAFTRAYVGNVHAIAHALGGYYNVVHGEVNAILMPYVFREYGQKAQAKLGEIADYLKLTSVADSSSTKAEKMINKIEELNANLGIANKILNVININDLDKLAAHAYQEANPFYPVPKIFTINDFIKVFKKVSNLQ